MIIGFVTTALHNDYKKINEIFYYQGLREKVWHLFSLESSLPQAL